MCDRQCLVCLRPILGQPREPDICSECRQRVIEAYDETRRGRERAELELFAMEFVVCWYCEWPLTDDGGELRPVDIHHIYGGPHRVHQRWNFASFCRHCHTLAHNLILSKEHVLWLKRAKDPAGYNRRALRKLIHPKTLPRPRRPPDPDDARP